MTEQHGGNRDRRSDFCLSVAGVRRKLASDGCLESGKIVTDRNAKQYANARSIPWVAHALTLGVTGHGMRTRQD